MNFKKVNNITGWIAFILAFLTFYLTREARGSFWDCGEFVSCAYKQQLPHPPGAPVFVMLGRLFIILLGNSPLKAANAVNTMSALASAGTILFLFWTITHFARKMLVSSGETLTGQQTFTAMGSGIVGALAYTFCDSFWYSAGEGEVYALSSFFTALVFWAMLKWEHADERAGNDILSKSRADRWIVFLFFMLGLAVGVHLLGLLTIPAIIMIYYYRRYKVTTKGAIIAFIIGCLVTGIVQVGVIQYSMKSAGLFDIFFVNSLGMPFFSGFAVYFIALSVVIAWGLRFSEKNFSRNKMIAWFIIFLALFALPFFTTTGSVAGQVIKFLIIAAIGAVAGYYIKANALKVMKLFLWCFGFMTLGYLMYTTALIRANADPSINMNDVNNPINLVYYLGREQYGSAPLIYGPNFVAEVDYDPVTGSPYKEGEMQYVKGKNHYVKIGRDQTVQYKSQDKQLFPRIWDPSNDQSHFDFYVSWLQLGTITAPETVIISNVGDNIVQTQNQAGKSQNYNIDDNYAIRVRRGQILNPGDLIAVKKPTLGDNLNWFFTYQMGLMYWRYFMWNFAGKQNDIEGLGNKRDGNWISGISFIDNIRLGDQSKLPDSLKDNKSHNKMFMLPFLLGIFGCVYQYLRNRKDWIVTFLLFFFTGIAIVLYLNQPGNQPRERDYAYAGSFYAYAIWVGLAVVSFVRLVREKEQKKIYQDTLVYGSILTFLVTLMSCLPSPSGSDVLLVSLLVTAMYAIIVLAIPRILRIISSGAQNLRSLNIAATGLCLIVPVIMGLQEWDDHDRSTKTLAPDMARDYLESCAPNAILFTFGDNDTYPLWYAQEVEGVRPDIRIINNSLLGIDWYINQLRHKVNDADSVNVIWSPEQIEGHNREIMYYQPDQNNRNISQNVYYSLYDVMKNVLGKPTIDPETGRDKGPDTYPVKRFSIPVDTAFVRKNGTVNSGDSVLSDVKFELGRNSLQRNDLMVLNIIAANNWKRPIYFSMPYASSGLGLDQYLRKDGMTYRLVPVATKAQGNNWIVRTQARENNLDFEKDNVMNKFVFASPKGTYFDEENRRHALEIRNVYAETAGNLADIGRKEEARQVLRRADSLIGNENLLYAMPNKDREYHDIVGLVFLEACYKAEDTVLAKKIKGYLKKDMTQEKDYYNYLRTTRSDLFSYFDGPSGDASYNEYLLQQLDLLEQRYEPQAVIKVNPPVLPKDSAGKVTNKDSLIK
ncbi:MAG: membrane protein [Sphingobacteriales bacterium UTBCD1]|jgi:hypothetical protein|nr:MAG: membrane protein [Sphingobacteriales bacterium UTBCD1]